MTERRVAGGRAVECTAERPAPGVVVWQPRRGFRYSMEPFLLGGWLLERHRPPARVLEVGCGSGVLALLLARLGFDVEGIDVLPEWIDLARRSAADSGLAVRFRVEDVRAPADGPPVDLAVSNPPWFPAGRGPLPADPFRAAARHEQAGTLAEIAAAMLRRARAAALVVPRSRGVEAELALSRPGRAVRRLDVGGIFTLVESAQGREGTERDEVGWGARVAGWYRALGARPPRGLEVAAGGDTGGA